MTPPGRRRELGFSVVEALIALAVAALAAALLLPMAARGVRDSFALADRGLDGADAAVAEADFRRLLLAAAPGLRGDASGLDLTADLAVPVACAPAGTDVGVRLQIVADRNGAGLVCRAAGRSTELARWPQASAAFAYDAGEGRWRSRWTPADGAPLVRLAVERQGRVRGLWIERAGGAPEEPAS